MNYSGAIDRGGKANIGDGGEMAVPSDDGFDPVTHGCDHALVFAIVDFALFPFFEAMGKTENAVALTERIEVDQADFFR